MKKVILYSISLILLLTRSFGAYAQEEESPIDKHIPTIIPPSPDAASLGKYGEFPVSLYTGTPSISVPIGQVSGHAIQVPISLSYHASGVKVEDIAPWVGLGWSLNAGGAITRVVKDKADDHVDGWLTRTSQEYILPVQDGVNGYVQYLYNAADGIIDTQPDLYNFNFMGYSGKFFLDKNRKAHLIPHQDVIINVPANFNNGEWEIITEDGTKYKFGGNAGGIGFSDFTETTISETIGSDAPSPTHVSAWYLKEVSRADRDDKVTFEYEKESIKYDTRVSYTDYSSTAGCEAKSPTTSYSNTINNTLHIKKIFVNGKLAAEFSNTLSSSIDNNMALFSRSDVFQSDGTTPASALKEITLYSVIDDQTPVKRFIMEYDHFISTETSAYSNWVTSNLNTTALSHRLRLKSVKEVSVQNPNDKKLLSAFTYNGGIPRRSSMSQDYWGYYNGALNNTLLPSIHGFKGGEGADRNVNPDVITNGMLTRIDYPTGGYSIFNFKAHRKEIEETLIIPEPKVLSFDQTYTSTGTNYSLGSFTLTHDQVVTLEYNIDHPFSFETDGIATIFIENQPDLWSSGGNNTVTKLLTAGTYHLKANIDLANTTVSGTLSYEKENPNGTGKSEFIDANGLSVNDKMKSGSFILAKPSGILFNINSSSATNSASVRIYRDGVFLQEATQISGISSNLFPVDDLPSGEYTIEVVNIGNTVINGLTVNAGYISYTIKNPYVGGLKVVKIENYDGTSTAPLVKQFGYEELKEVSPIDGSNFLHTQTELTNAQCPEGYGNLCGYLVRTSSNRSFLGATQGSPVGYKKVTTIIGENAEMGKTVDEFTYYGNVGGGGFPFPPATDNQYKSGLLEKQTVYNAAGVKLKESSNTYNFIPLASIDAQIASYRYNHPCLFNDGTENYELLQSDLITLSTTFSYNSEWVQNISSTETVYDLDDPANSITSTTNNYYEDAVDFGNTTFHSKVTKTVATNSKGEEIITEFKYPRDNDLSETLDTEAQATKTLMKSLNYNAPVLETIVSKKVNSVTTLLSKTRTNFKTYNGFIQRRNIDLSFTGQPYESRVEFQDYDDQGHLLRVNKVKDAYTSYIWGYDNTLPIARQVAFNTSTPFRY